MSRGGIKQVVAATTLTAMAMTGNTVSAFGLANALAEGSAHVETTPEQENNGGAFEGVTVESIEEGNGDEDGGTDAVAATDTGSADEVVVMDAEEAIMEVEDALFGEEEAPLNEAGEAVELETIEEVEFDLSEANGEAEGTIIDENPEDPEQTMKDLINMAVEERRTEGIYAALNTTFATLAENAEALANPETGVIETDGNAIVNMTYDALKSSFDNTPEELMGAIGAAAMRADSAGYIQILGGDQALVNLASINIDADQVEKDILKSGKIGYDSFLDGPALANPAFKPYVPLFKAIGGELFGALGGSADPNAVILSRLSEMDKKLDAIEAQITQTEQELKDHSYNVVSLAFLGDENNTVQKLNGTVRTYIGDIMNPENTSKTDAEKLQALADMYDDPLFKSLVSAVEGATLCFTSTHNDIFQKQNVFEAAYDRACEEVMFSGEAVDLTIPYLTVQLTIFEEACVTLNAVYDAREAVYGAGSVSESREKMSLRLSGLDRNGNKVQNSVFECFSEYLGKDRFIFVNRSNNTNIKLNTNLLVFENFSAICTLTAISDKRNDWTLPYFVGQTPLSTDQVESLADYCKQRNITIWDFLVHDMGFGIQKIRPTDTNFREVGDLEEARVRNPSEAERQAQQITGIKYTPNIYITGAQKTGKLEKDIKNTLLSKYEKYWVKMNVINACVKGAGNENKLLRYFRTNTNTSNPTNKIYDIHLLMFQSR